jgi:hypothetical protein
MLKDYGIIKRISSQMASAADEVANSVLGDYSNLQGREEEVTGQLRGEINRQLLANVSRRLNHQEINGCRISVATFKKKQENSVGADLAGIIEFSRNGYLISKAFLAQAKVGSSYVKGQQFVKAYNKDVVRQAEDMLKISSDSFFFVYSDIGIYCVPALQVALSGSNTIDTGHHPFHTFGTFYEEFMKCFIGDHLISPLALGATSLEDYAEKVKVLSVLKLGVQLSPASETRI